MLYRAFILCVCLAWPAVSQATLTVSLENPGDGGSVSGLSVISGWAFSDSDAPITVALRVNGEPYGPVPCCGPRQDVMDAIPGAPLHTAFGMLFNYGLLDAGVHSLGVEVTAPGEEPVFVEHPVRVVKPGGRWTRKTAKP